MATEVIADKSSWLGVNSKAVSTSRWWPYAALLLLWLLHTAANVWWLLVDTRPATSDIAGHAVSTMQLAYGLQTPSAIWWRTILAVNPYPPFIYLLAAPFNLLFGYTLDAMLAANIIMFGVLIGATYAMGRRMAGVRGGLLSAFIVSMYPVIYGLSRHYLLDMPLAAMTALAVATLLWSDYFRHTRLALLCGLVLGLGMLTKWTLLVFVAGPLLVAAYVLLRDFSWVRLRNALLAAILAVGVAAPWYLYNWARLGPFLQIGSVYAAAEGDPTQGSWGAWLFYLWRLNDQQILAPFFLLVIIGALLIVRARLWSRELGGRDLASIGLWFLLSYLAFSYLFNKDVRYTMPYLPALAIVSGVGLAQLPQFYGVIVRRLVYTLLILYAAVQFAGLTFGLRDRDWPLVNRLPLRAELQPAGIALTYYAEVVHIASPPQREDWQLAPILDFMMADAAQEEMELPLQLVVVPAIFFFDGPAFDYQATAARLPILVYSTAGITAGDSLEKLQNASYILIKTGNQGADYFLQDGADLTTQLVDPTSELGRKFELAQEFPLPDGSTAQLYRND